jgi:hypothetical protein
MDYLLDDGGEFFPDLRLESGREARPDGGGLGGPNPSHWAASVTRSLRAGRVSFVRATGRDGMRLVAATGMRKSIYSRYATKTWPGPGRDDVRDTTGNRRPNSGWVGSVTSISDRSWGTGFLRGVLR